MALQDPFQYLSEDKIYEICESLDDRSLSQLVQTSRRANFLCQEILRERRKKYETEIEKRVGPIFGYIQDGEFYIKNFFDVGICSSCQSRNITLMERPVRSADEGLSYVMKCLDCQKSLRIYGEHVRPAVKCSSLTKGELLLLAERIGYQPESYDLNQYTKDELCMLLRKFFERHGLMHNPPITHTPIYV